MLRYEGPLEAPHATWRSSKPPRADHDTPAWLTATEFRDAPAARVAKVKQLAALLRASKKTVVYTGAGISAAVVGQAAESGTNKVGWKGDTRKVKPTYTHHALGLLGQRGVVQSWVQQNHDGLPQKAGFPQQNINEIHGSWYDPSNPVVKYSGTLHELAYPWMEQDAETADLVLVLGTSLGGLNADQVPVNTAERSLLGPSHARASLGAVCINLQQTPQDGKMTLRLFGKSDNLLKMLLAELGMSLPHGAVLRGVAWPKADRACVPYDAEGKLLEPGSGRPMMLLDLSPGARVRITPGHNIQGARQPMYMHTGAKKPHKHKGVLRQPARGNGVVSERCDASSSYLLDIEGVRMRLGIWWLVAARTGAVPRLPVVNQTPTFQ